MRKIVQIPGSGIGPEVLLPMSSILSSLGPYECIVYENIDKIADILVATSEISKYYQIHIENQSKIAKSYMKFIENQPKISKSPVMGYQILDGIIKKYLFSRDPAEKLEYSKYKYRGISQEFEDTVKKSDACLFGSISDPNGGYLLFWFRQGLDLFANVRPAKALPNVPCLNKNIDFVIIRENTEGLYLGMEYFKPDAALAIKVLSKKGIERIIQYAFHFTETRKSKGTKGELICVDKSNALPICDGYFRSNFQEIANKYPAIQTKEWYVDRAAMELIRAPETIDVIVTSNLYGDILSDESAALIGGLGVTPSGEYGEHYALFQPVSGTAPDIAGRNIANPLSALFSTVMMLEYLEEFDHAKALETAILHFLQAKKGFTPDLGGNGTTSGVFTEIIRYL